MDFYKYKCNDCGSTRFEKTENGYKCKYCGNIQDIIRTEVKKPEQKTQETEVKQEQEQEGKVAPIKFTEKFKSALISLLICVFGGWFGLHKFLKGQIFWGIVYAVSGGLFGVGYVIDIIGCVIDLAGTVKAGGEE